MCSCYGKLAERRFRGIDPLGNPVIPPHVCPWIASAITAHTRRELLKVALIASECVIGFATDAIYLEILVPGIPRLKAEDDIKAGKEEKLLGDWCWGKVPAAVFIQSGLALYLDKEGKVAEVKCRGLPIKKLEKAQKFLDDVLEAWKISYNPESIDRFGHKRRPTGRHASVEIHAFMPLHSAIVSPKKFRDLFCKWGDVTKTVWLDDTGGKRTINEFDLTNCCLATEAIPTMPKENPTPDVLSAIRFPDWVENEMKEKSRQKAAVNQYYKLDAADVPNPDTYDEEGYYEDAEFETDNEFDQLMEANQDIEV